MGAATTKQELVRSADRISSASGAKQLERRDLPAYFITLGCAAGVIVITALLVYVLWSESALARHKFGWRFLFTQDWDPVAENFGALPFIYGTVVTSVIALLIAVPMGVGAAIFLAELAPPRISSALTFMIELLAAVPSVIFGLLGIFVLVSILHEVVPTLKDVLGFLPLFQGPFYGVSMLSAGIVLSIMIVPFIISISREVLSQFLSGGARDRRRQERRDGKPLGAWWFPRRIRALSVPSSWLWQERSVKRWL